MGVQIVVHKKERKCDKKIRRIQNARRNNLLLFEPRHIRYCYKNAKLVNFTNIKTYTV